MTSRIHSFLALALLLGCRLTVAAAPAVTLEAPWRLTLGEPAQRVAASSASGQPVHLTTPDPAVCSVDESGLLQIHRGGLCRIHATLSDMEAQKRESVRRHLRVMPRVDFALCQYSLLCGAGLDSRRRAYALDTRSDFALPSRLRTDARLVQFSRARSHTLAIDDEGGIHAWGNNQRGALGDGTLTSRDEPVRVQLPDGDRAIRVLARDLPPGSGDAEFSMAIGESGRLYAWGLSDINRVGDSWPVYASPQHYALPTDAPVVDIDSNGHHVLLLDGNGTVFRVSASAHYDPAYAPVQVQLPGDASIVQVAAGNWFDLALAADGRIFHWPAGAHAEVLPKGLPVILPASIARPIVELDVGRERDACLLDDEASMYCFDQFLDTPLGEAHIYRGVVSVDMDVPGYLLTLADGSLRDSSDQRAKVTAYNDRFDERYELTGESGTAVGFNAGATSEDGEDVRNNAHLGRTVWWRWTAPRSGIAEFDLAGSEFDTLLTIFRGEELGTLTRLASNNDDGDMHTSRLTFEVEAGTEYQISVDGHSLTPTSVWWPDPAGSSGDIHLSWQIDPRQPQRLLTGATVPIVLLDAGADVVHALPLHLSSGLAPVVYSETPSICRWADGELSALRPGYCRLTVTQAGNPDFAPWRTRLLLTIGRPFAGGWLASFRVVRDGHLMSWGFGEGGVLADDTFVSRLRAAPARAVDTPVAGIAAGQLHMLVLDTSGRIRAWGSNFSGELGAPGMELTQASPALPGDARVLQITAGSNFSMALSDDLNIYTWGDNGYGQLGSLNAPQLSPWWTRVDLPADVAPVAISAGGSYALALDAAGRLYEWGSLNHEWPNAVKPRPRKVNFPAGVRITSMSVGSDHALALTDTGEVYGWGASSFGALGTASWVVAAEPQPLALPDGTAVVAVSAHSGFSALQTADGRLLVSGPVGSSSMTIEERRATPPGFRAIALPEGLRAVALPTGGYQHLLVELSDGQLYGWGENEEGQLGLGDRVLRRSPARIPDPPPNDLRRDAEAVSGVTGLSSGSTRDAAREEGEPDHGMTAASGSIWWRYHATASTPMRFVVQGTPASRSIALYTERDDGTLLRGGLAKGTGSELRLVADIAEGSDYLIAVSGPDSASGSVTLSWQPDDADTGDGDPAAPVVFVTPPRQLTVHDSAPLVVLTVPGASVDMVSLSPETCRVDGTTVTALRVGLCRILAGVADQPATSNILRMSVVSQVAHGSAHHLYRAPSGHIEGWGDNRLGQLGNGTFTGASGQTGVASLPAGVSARAIAARGARSVAVGSDRQLYVWGLEWALRSGPAGSDATSSGLGGLTGRAVAAAISALKRSERTSEPPWRSTPATMNTDGMPPPLDVALGDAFGLVLTDDASLYAWGDNNRGQLGDAPGGSSITPVKVVLDGEVIDFAAGAQHAVAALASGQIVAWGGNSHSQAGGAGVATVRPSKIEHPDGLAFHRVAAGDQHSLALAEDGRIVGWGNNRHGQLGVAGIDVADTPVDIPLSATGTVTDIAASAGYSMALDSSGYVYVWGRMTDRSGNPLLPTTSAPQRLTLPDGVTGLAIVAGEHRFSVLCDDGVLRMFGDDQDIELTQMSVSGQAVPVFEDAGD